MLLVGGICGDCVCVVGALLVSCVGWFVVRCGLFIVIFCYAFCRCSSLLGFEFVGYCVCVWLYL